MIAPSPDSMKSRPPKGALNRVVRGGSGWLGLAALLAIQHATPAHGQIMIPPGGALFRWVGVSGDVSNPNNWTFVLGSDMTITPPPGPLDLAIIQSQSNITVTGALNVNGATIGTETNAYYGSIVTMAGSVSAGLNGVSAQDAVFQGTVTTTGLVVTFSMATFQSSVSAGGLSAGGQTTFASGSSLAATGPVLTTGTLAFTGGASGSSQTGTPAIYAANPVFFSNTTALQVNGTLALTGASFTASGDTVVGEGSVSNPSTIQITNGGSLVTTGSLLVGVAYTDGGTGQIQPGSGLVVVNSGVLESQGITLGDGGPGTLNVKNGGLVTSKDSFVAFSANSPSTVDIATGGSWNLTGNLFLGFGDQGQVTVESGGTLDVTRALFVGFPSSGGNGSLIIQNGGIVNTGTALGTTDTGADLGGPAGEAASVTVDGSNSKWTSNGAVLIGSSGGAVLTVSNGATVNVQASMDVGFDATGALGGKMLIESGGKVMSGTGLSAGALAGAVGFESGATGTVTIDGAGSTWDVQQRLNIGLDGTGTVTVQNGGTLQVDGDIIRIGRNADGTGTLIFTAAGGTTPTLTFTGGANNQLLIGDQGIGHFFVQGGAQISTTGSVIIGNASTAIGTATLQGQGSSWNITGDVTVGLDGTGTLTVKDGNILKTNGGNITLGENTGSTGTFVVDGAGSGFDMSGGTNGQLTIGVDGAGILQVQNGASVTLGSTVLGSGTQGTGEISVIGSGSGPVSSVVINGTLTVGGSSSGSGPTQSSPQGLDGGILSISGGGSVSVMNGDLVVARDAGSTGEIDISGQNSRLTIANNANLIIGKAGLGTMNISNQATLTVNALTISQNGPTGNPAQESKVMITGNTQGGVQTILTVTGALTVGDSGTGELDVTGGAVLQTFQTVNVGNQSASMGTVSVTGNSTWNATGGQINIGVSGTGTVDLQSGAVLENANNVSIAATDGIGTLNVTTASAGMNSLNLGGGNGFALTSYSVLSIMQGGSVHSNTLAIGGNSAITVDGQGGPSNTPSSLSVGSLSFSANVLNAAITVSNGGQFTVTSGNIATPGGDISVNVTGQNSTFSAPNSTFTLSASVMPGVSVGATGGGTLITGATVLGQNAVVSIGASGDTAKSTWNITPNAGAISGSLLSVQPGGSLQINAGGTVNVSGEAMVSGSLALLELSGDPSNIAGFSASQIDITQQAFFTVNAASQVTATGLINIQTGGTVALFGSGASVSSATMTVGAGSLLVADSDSHVSVGSRLVVSGTLNVLAGGRVDIGAVLNGAPDGSIAIGFGGVLKNSGNVFASSINLGLGAVAGGNGNLNGAVVNGGKIAPGDPQTMTINGSYTQLPTGTLDLQVGGPNPADSDHLVVNGPATFAGHLELDFINGFAPTAGEVFNLLSFGSAVGQFTNVEITGLAPGWTFTLNPAGTGFGLTSTSNAVFSPEFLVPSGPNTILAGVLSNQTVHFLGGTLEATGSTVLPNAVILDVTGGIFQADDGTSSTLAGVISGPGTFIKTGPGTLTLLAANTYTGNTYIAGGSLFVDGSLASPEVFVNFGALLGGTGTLLGNVFNAGTVSPGDAPGTLHFSGNYAQGSTGLLQIRIGGGDLTQHDLLSVGGTAKLDGTLQLVQLNNFQLKRNQSVTFLTADAGVNGRFATVENGFTSDTILQPTVVYGSNSVALEALQGSFATLPGLTPNQQSVGRALDSAANDRRTNALFDYLDYRALNKLPGDLDKIAPEELTSVYTLGVSLATVQSLNVQRRTDDIRSGSSGFNAANLALNGDGPSYNGGFGITTGVAGPSGDDGKEVKETKEVAPAENRWGVFLSGTGEWVSVGNTDNARGYDLESGGFTLGVDYKVTPNLAIGLAAGYTGTTADLTDHGRIWVNGGQIGLYGTFFQNQEVFPAPTMSKDSSKDSSKEAHDPAPLTVAKGFYADVAVFGGYNSYDTRRSALQGEARGSTDGGELNVLFGTGYDFKSGGLTFGPTATFNYTYIGTSDFTEHGSLAPLDVHGGKGESLRSAFGFKASYDWKVGGIVIKPELRAAWQHEYGDAAYAMDSSFASGAGNSFLVNGPKLGRDSALLGAGFAIQLNERLSTYFYYDGELGRTNYQSTNVTGGVRFAF